MRRLLSLSIFLLAGICVQTAKASTERYRLIWNDDPTTTMTIAWDQISGNNTLVYYDLIDHGTEAERYANTQAVDEVIEYRSMKNCFVRLKNLKPDTRYYFIIVDNQGKSKRFWFQTAPNQPDKRLSFIAGGDSRNNRQPRQSANRLVAKLRPHAVLFAGDMTAGDSNSEWIEWFDDWQLTIGTDGKITPIIPARGNHEYSAYTLQRLFDLPQNAYYALTFGGSLLRFYTLNTEIAINGTQTDWLEEDLGRQCDTRWRMAQYHKPMRPHVASKPEGISQYIYWAPLFYQYNLNLVIECDAHTSKATWPIRHSTGSGSDEGFVQDREFGTTYIGEGCWGAPLRASNDTKTWTRASGMFNQFKWIFVSEEKIESRTVIIEGPEETNKVATVSDNDIFSPPANLNIWHPPSGSVISVTSPQLHTEIKYPISGTHFPILPQKVKIEATAFDGNGSINQVDFFINGTWMGSDNRSPFHFDWNLKKPGEYQLRVVATDNKKNKKYSCPVRISADHTVLPSEFKYFNVLLSTGGKVTVRWETSAALDHKYYRVERAGTDQNYVTLHEQEYFGSSVAGIKYLYEDPQPLPGLSYYRVRAVSNDGSYLFSKVIEVKMPGKVESNLKVYPSPVGRDKFLSIEFFATQDHSLHLYLIDQGGKEVVYLNKQVKKGNNWFQLKPGPISPGIYYLKVEDRTFKKVEKVVFE